MKTVLPILVSLFACCCTLHADPWLTIESVTATIEAPPPERFPGDQWPAEALHVLVTATDGSGADEVALDPARLVMEFGPDIPPAPCFGIDKARIERRPDQPARISAGLWFPLPEGRSELQDMELRLAVSHYRHEVTEVPFVPGAEGWEFPLNVRNAWLDFTVIGVGLGELAEERVSISRWVVGGNEMPDRVHAAPAAPPQIVATAVATLIESDNTVSVDELLIDFGDFAAHADTVQTHYGLHEQQSETGLWRRAADYAFRYQQGLENCDLAQLPPIQAITLRVIRRIRLDEARAPVALSVAEE